MVKKSLFFVVLALFGVVLSARFGIVQAMQDGAAVVQGAMLYDRWFTVLNTQPPAEDMPLWEQQTTNTRSGEDTWRCVSCHGWDYQGRDGAYRYGSNRTGFPGVFAAREDSPDTIIAALKGANNPQHDFSAYLDDASMNALAAFMTTALIDDNEFIDPQTLAVKGGDAAHGEQLYTESCASCHGEDGTEMTFRFEGRDAWMGTLAALDPWRFLHRTRFGNPGTPMPVGYELGWTPQDGRDVLLYVRSLPSGLESEGVAPSMEGREDQGDLTPGGPVGGFFGGILTALGAVATAVGFAVIIGGFLVGVIFLIVWLIRGSNKG